METVRSKEKERTESLEPSSPADLKAGNPPRSVRGSGRARWHADHAGGRKLLLGTRIQTAVTHLVVSVALGYLSHWFLLKKKRIRRKITNRQAFAAQTGPGLCWAPRLTRAATGRGHLE